MSVQNRRSAFTLIELLVVIAIIAILAAILFPVFAQAREKARAITCVSNEKQMALGMMQYVQDYDEMFPMAQYADSNSIWHDWASSINPYIKNGTGQVASGAAFSGFSGIWACPSFPSPQDDNYGINDQIVPTWPEVTGSGYHRNSMAAIQAPADKILVVEKGEGNAGGYPIFFSEEDAWNFNPGRDWNFTNGGTCENVTNDDSSPSFDWDDPIGPNPSAQTLAAGWEGPAGSPRFRHQMQCSSLFCDGHVKPIRKGQMSWCKYIYVPGVSQVW